MKKIASKEMWFESLEHGGRRRHTPMDGTAPVDKRVLIWSCARIDMKVYPELGCMNAHRENGRLLLRHRTTPGVEPE